MPDPVADTDGVRAFYDDLSRDYRGIYADWDEATRRQGAALSAQLPPGPLDLLDCACGVGTQLVGLARLGHRVTGSDLSPASVEQARRACAERGLTADLQVADLRALPFGDAAFDAVVCADNALPHLLTGTDVAAALAGMRRVLRPGGTALVTTRDYDALDADRPVTAPVQRSADDAGLRRVTTQLWDWSADGRTYRLTHLQARETAPGVWTAAGRETTYRAWRRAELSALAVAAGFADVEWLTPAASGFFQPVLRARRPAS